MNVERLVAMANDIAAFFDAEPDKSVAAKDVAYHLKRFWDPRMRAELADYVRQGGAGLSELGRAAVTLLGADAQPKSS